jgi:hypothetical protein
MDGCASGVRATKYDRRDHARSHVDFPHWLRDFREQRRVDAALVDNFAARSQNARP